MARVSSGKGRQANSAQTRELQSAAVKSKKVAPKANGGQSRELQSIKGELAAINKSQAVIEFSLDGKILNANDNFLSTVGYALSEIQGQHHSMFVDPVYRASPEYRAFWDKLARGEYDAGQYKRIGKGGTEIWIQASYNPILDMNGKPFKVVKFATNITEQKLKIADFEGQLGAISKAQAVIEFDLTGMILTANQNFLETMGYSLPEIKGQHHSMFLDPVYRASTEYRAFWDKLGRGEYNAGQYKRIGKGGREIWIQASYNPILDMNGKPFKIVKFATDITEQKLKAADFEGQLGAISKAQAVIEFDLTGTILTANENFLTVMGYSLPEIKGQHHAMFIDPGHRASPEYRAFWDKLARGEYDAGQYRRIGKGSREIWIQASYNPIFDMNGKPFKVVKYATDITREKLAAADFEGQLSAISKVQAVIEFTTDGKILNANENFMRTVGYSLPEIKGQHHSMFVEPGYRQSSEYRLFWDKLGRGEHDSGQYKRIGKGGQEIWLQASYNPIIGPDGKPFKVVKYATDLTEQVRSSRALHAAVAQTQEVIEAAKANDLSKRVPLEGKTAEIEKLCGGINELLDTMADVVISMLDASATISNAVSEITTGTSDLSQRTEQQASNLEETAASMQEMATTIKANADNAQQANQHAISATQVATEGGRVVGKAVDAMSLIETSSQKISDIIGVIDEIAFQTNLLALNAAVEAARAGDAGKGFAVVASEVRSLAQRSSGAAKDIKALIAASGAQVKDGVKLVNNAGIALQDIVVSIKRVADIVSDIALASKEQSTSVEEINKAVSHMDEMTQQNSALVEENAAACRMLQEQAQDMHGRMSEFQLDQSRAPAPFERAKRAAAPTARPAGPAARKAVGTRGAVGLQAALQSSLNADADWKEF